ncbi:hypothetical protein [Rhizobium leguminosarum]
MIESKEQHKGDEPQPRPSLPNEVKFFDPWEEEFRRMYEEDDKVFEF